MDIDQSGTVERNELFNSLKQHGYGRQALQEKKINEDVNKILLAADKNKDGKLDFEEFVETICNQIDSWLYYFYALSNAYVDGCWTYLIAILRLI